MSSYLDLMMENKPDLVITGTGRCGTKYLTRVLRDCGIRASHQRYFSRPDRKPEFGMKVDVSCFAVDYLDRYNGEVWGLVRNPLKVLTSFLANHKKIMDTPKIRAFRQKYFGKAVTPEMMYINCIVNINEKILERCSRLIRIEELKVYDIMLISEITDTKVPELVAGKVLKRTPTNINKHHDKKYMAFSDIENEIGRKKMELHFRNIGYSKPYQPF